MFALPSFQFSRTDAEARQAKRRSADRDSLQDGASTTSSTSSRIASGVSAAVQALSPSRLRLEHPKAEVSTNISENKEERTILPVGFGEHPRAAPTPPVRRGSTAPPEGWWSTAKSGGALTTPSSAHSKSTASPTTPSSGVEDTKGSPPRIPAKSPKRQKIKATRQASDIVRLLEEDPFCGGGSSSGSRSKRKNRAAVKKISSAQGVGIDIEQPEKPSRSFTAPVQVPIPAVDTPVRTNWVHVKSTTSDDRGMADPLAGPSTALVMRTKLAGVQGGRVDKSIKRLSTGSTIRTEGLDLEDLSTFLRLTTPPTRTLDGQGQEPLLGRRQRQGETISMLLRSNFFPAGSVDEKNSTNWSFSVPAPLALVDKTLPPTPTSITATPTELYHVKAIRPLRPTVRNVRKPAVKRRSPLSQVSSTNSRRNNSKISPPQDIPRLPAILESLPPNLDNTPPQSVTTTPIATQIHLRGGSVVTVFPPEVTAWQRSVYIQGQIRLPKRVIIPRKNSVASLEPFQEVIDQVYQEALAIPRRRSDEQVLDDVCGFFDEFGFDEVGFEGDRFDIVWEDVGLDEGVAYAHGWSDFDIERFSTPAMDPEATPVEKVMAKGITGTMTRPFLTQAPPVDAAEWLRGPGIARVAQGGGGARSSLPHRPLRKDSHTLTITAPPEDCQLQLLPDPEHSMLDAILVPSRTEFKPGDCNSSGGDSI